MSDVMENGYYRGAREVSLTIAKNLIRNGKLTLDEAAYFIGLTKEDIENISAELAISQEKTNN